MFAHDLTDPEKANRMETLVSNRMNYSEQSAQDLRLNVIEGEFDLSQFQVFKTEVLRISPEITVRAMIIGKSHAVCFQVADLRLHEVFACGEVSTPRSRAFCGQLREVTDSVRINLDQGFTYGFLASTKRWPEGSAEIRRMESESADSGGFCLSYDFPQGSNREPATTVVTGFADEIAASLVIRTAHSYPNEETIIISSSELSTGENRSA